MQLEPALRLPRRNRDRSKDTGLGKPGVTKYVHRGIRGRNVQPRPVTRDGFCAVDPLEDLFGKTIAFLHGLPLLQNKRKVFRAAENFPISYPR